MQFGSDELAKFRDYIQEEILSDYSLSDDDNSNKKSLTNSEQIKIARINEYYNVKKSKGR